MTAAWPRSVHATGRIFTVQSLGAGRGGGAIATPVALRDRPAHHDGPWPNFARSSQALIRASASRAPGCGSAACSSHARLRLVVVTTAGLRAPGRGGLWSSLPGAVCGSAGGVGLQLPALMMIAGTSSAIAFRFRGARFGRWDGCDDAAWHRHSLPKKMKKAFSNHIIAFWVGLCLALASPTPAHDRWPRSRLARPCPRLRPLNALLLAG